MFGEGLIVYFDPFYFKNGNPAKPKYFLVLKNVNNKSLLASLPTRKDNIPQLYEKENGCIELPEINLNCFVITPETEVTMCGKHFDFKTHIYGHQLDDYDVKLIKEIYPVVNADYFIWGTMKTNLFLSLIDCLKNSKSVKRKYLKILNQT